MNERITITIKKNLLDRVDNLVDKKGIRSRSHAFDIIIRDYFNRFRIKNAVVLCGGENPNFAKTVYNDVVLNRIIKFLKNENVEKIYVTVNKKNKNKIREIIEEDGINLIEEDKPLGTGGALKPLKEKLNETFLVINGDIYFELDLKDFMMFHRENKSLITLCLTSTKKPMDYGVVLARGSKIVEFVEKPKVASSYLINAGIFAAEPEIFKFMPEDETVSLESDVLPELAKSERLSGYLLSGKWLDVGRVEEVI